MANRGPRRPRTSAPATAVATAYPRAPGDVGTREAPGDAVVAVWVAARGHSTVSTRPSAREALGAVPAAADQLATSARFVTASPDARQQHPSSSAEGGHVTAPPRHPRKVVPAAPH